MNKREFNMHFENIESVETENERFAGLLNNLYDKMKEFMLRRKIKALLLRLQKQRQEIDSLIEDLNSLLHTLENNSSIASDNKNSNSYVKIFDKYIEHTAKDIWFIILDMTETLEENDLSNFSDICYHSQYRISKALNASIHSMIDSQNLLRDKNIYFIIQKNFFNMDIFCDRIYCTYIIDHNRNLYEKGKEISEDSYSMFRAMFSKYLFTWRTKNNMTQVELALKSGIDRTMLTKIEKLQQAASLKTTLKLLDSVGARLMIIPAKIREEDRN